MSSLSTNAPHEPLNKVGRPDEKVALFPGSFDPFTIGHASIVRRALALFDRVVVGVGYNINKRALRVARHPFGQRLRI